MTTQEIGEMLNAIGQDVADILQKVPQHVFVFIEGGEGWQGGGVFDNLEDRVIYYDPNHSMMDHVERLWEAADTEKKWGVLLYDIKDGKFTVEYLYPEPLFSEDGNEYDNHDEILDDALQARFGDKPVIYPPPDDMWDLTEEDLKDD